MKQQERDESKCPICMHLLDRHDAEPLRHLMCMDCLCDVKVKWRYAWAVCLFWLGLRQGRHR